MSFRDPLALVGLALLPLAIAAYVAAQRRRRRFAVRYTNVDLLASVAGASWLRHVPALLALLALAALLVSLGRPERTVAAQRKEATVVLVTDTSGSMLANDVRPNRLIAAREAARTLARQVPEDFRIGLIKFGSQAEQVLEPTTDRTRLNLALQNLSVKGATAMGDGLKLGLDAANTPIPDGLGGTRKLPTAMVLLSDGANTTGENDPIDVAQAAKKARIKIYTVALGTPGGVLETKRKDGSTKRESVPPDTLTLQEIARETGGRYFNAPDADQLQAIYSGLATRFATVREKQEMTSAFAGGGLVLLVGGLAFSLLRGGRLP
jgi:Ca-activated chloride channel family protein